MSGVLRPGVWIASDSGDWWPMTAPQRAAWAEYIASHRWQHEGMGGTRWMGADELRYRVSGYSIVVRGGGAREYMRTSDGVLRQVLSVGRSEREAPAR
jgi:hypothetical protein